jgi:hypothetical protein
VSDDEPTPQSPKATSPHGSGPVDVDTDARAALAALSRKLSPAQFRAALRDFGAQVAPLSPAYSPHYQAQGSTRIPVRDVFQ